MLCYLCLNRVLRMVRLGMNSDRSIVLTGFPITPDRKHLLGIVRECYTMGSLLRARM